MPRSKTTTASPARFARRQQHARTFDDGCGHVGPLGRQQVELKRQRDVAQRFGKLARGDKRSCVGLWRNFQPQKGTLGGQLVACRRQRAEFERRDVGPNAGGDRCVQMWDGLGDTVVGQQAHGQRLLVAADGRGLLALGLKLAALAKQAHAGAARRAPLLRPRAGGCSSNRPVSAISFSIASGSVGRNADRFS